MIGCSHLVDRLIAHGQLPGLQQRPDMTPNAPYVDLPGELFAPQQAQAIQPMLG